MLYRLVENTQLTKTVWRMKLAGDTSAIKAPGQFVQLTVPGFYLRRPISICDWDDTTITLVYKVVGQGTEAMSAMIQCSACLSALRGWYHHKPGESA